MSEGGGEKEENRQKGEKATVLNAERAGGDWDCLSRSCALFFPFLLSFFRVASSIDLRCDCRRLPARERKLRGGLGRACEMKKTNGRRLRSLPINLGSSFFLAVAALALRAAHSLSLFVTHACRRARTTRARARPCGQRPSATAARGARRRRRGRAAPRAPRAWPRRWGCPGWACLRRATTFFSLWCCGERRGGKEARGTETGARREAEREQRRKVDAPECSLFFFCRRSESVSPLFSFARSLPLFSLWRRRKRNGSCERGPRGLHRCCCSRGGGRFRLCSSSQLPTLRRSSGSSSSRGYQRRVFFVGGEEGRQRRRAQQSDPWRRPLVSFRCWPGSSAGRGAHQSIYRRHQLAPRRRGSSQA